MTAKRLFFGLIGLIGLSILGVGGTIYLGNNLLITQSDKLIDLKAQNQALEDQMLSLAKAKQNIEKYKNLEELTQAIVPRDKDQARATREILTLANDSGVPIKTITFPASNLGTKVAAPQADTNANPDQTSGEAPPLAISQAKPVAGINGVYSLETTIIPNGTVSYYQLIDFLSRLEKNRRTAQVTSIKIDPKSSSRNNPQLTFVLTTNIFLRP